MSDEKAKKLKINVNGAALSVLCTRPGDYKEGVSPERKSMIDNLRSL